ncbi:hypothetical protein D3C72_1467290 [compost metagenome]
MMAMKATPPSVIRDRQIGVLSRQIDNAVREAFGLTEAEAAMAERREPIVEEA